MTRLIYIVVFSIVGIIFTGSRSRFGDEGGGDVCKMQPTATIDFILIILICFWCRFFIFMQKENK